MLSNKPIDLDSGQFAQTEFYVFLVICIALRETAETFRVGSQFILVIFK